MGKRERGNLKERRRHPLLALSVNVTMPESGAIMCDCVEFEDYLGNVG